MRTARLGEVAEFVNGFPFEPGDWHDAGLPIIRIQNLTDPEKPINLTNRRVPHRYTVRRGDLLVSWSATLGVFVWDRTDEALVNQHIFRVAPFEYINQDFLRHMLEGALRAMGRHLHGATMKHVNRAEFLATEIPLPSLDEQRRIAAILDQADAIRTKRRQVLARLDTLTQSIFHDMFGAPSGDRWPLVKMCEVVSRIDSGTSPNCETRRAAGHEWAVLKLGAVTYGNFRPSDNKAYLGIIGSMQVNEVRSGDVLMTRKNTRDLVGAVALVDEAPPRLLLPDLIFRLQLDLDRIDRRYFHALMMHPGKRESVRGLSNGSASSMPNISKARLMQLPVELPPISLQREFASRVERVNGGRVQVERALVADDALFASLQARAFSGEL